MLTLVTGGARSGKSRHAEALIADAPQVLYIATSQIFDDEMAARIQHHRDGRPAHWRTAERWQQLDELITPAIAPAEAILLECITTMVTNLLFALGGDSDPDGWDYAAMERAIDDEIGVLIAACQRCPAHVVLVTNEVGMGIVPENRPARHFRDIAGRVNQRPGGRGGCGLAGGLRHRRQNQITQSLADRASPRQGFCMQNLNTVLRAIPAPDADAMARAQQHIDGLLKPPAASGVWRRWRCSWRECPAWAASRRWRKRPCW